MQMWLMTSRRGRGEGLRGIVYPVVLESLKPTEVGAPPEPELLPKKIFHKIPCPSPLAMIIMQMTSLVPAQLSTRPIADGAILGRRTPVWQ